jgi:hypothetical protein
MWEDNWASTERQLCRDRKIKRNRQEELGRDRKIDN